MHITKYKSNAGSTNLAHNFACVLQLLLWTRTHTRTHYTHTLVPSSYIASLLTKLIKIIKSVVCGISIILEIAGFTNNMIKVKLSVVTLAT